VTIINAKVEGTNPNDVQVTHYIFVKVAL